MVLQGGNPGTALVLRQALLANDHLHDAVTEQRVVGSRVAAHIQPYSQVKLHLSVVVWRAQSPNGTHSGKVQQL